MAGPNAKAQKTLKQRAAKVLPKPALEDLPPSAPDQIIVKKTFEESLAAGRTSISAFANDFLDIEFYDKQALVMDNSLDATEVTFVAANRTGKSFSSAVWCIHRAFYQHLSPYLRPEKLSWKNPYKIFTTSLTQDQANIVFSYIRSFVENPKMSRFVADLKMSPWPILTLNTRASGTWRTSIIEARSLANDGKNILGQSLAGILVDECAFVPRYEYVEEMVLKMRMAEWGGTIFRISSPAGKSNHLYRYFLKGGWDKDRPNALGIINPRFYSARLSSYDNPYLSKAFLEEQAANMDPLLYQQNVLGEFVDAFDFFSLPVIQGLYDGADWALPEDRQLGHTYVLGADLAALRDATVVFVLDVTAKPWRVVYAREMRQASWPAVREFVKGAWALYEPAVSYIDATGVGRPIFDQLQLEDNLPGLEPFVFTTNSKPDLLTRLQDAAQRQKLKFPFGPATKRLIDEMSVYKLEDKQLSTDYVMAFALAHMAGEHFNRNGLLDTTIYDDLAVIPVGFGGQQLPQDLILGTGEEYVGGMKYQVDSETGLFVPMGFDPEEDLYWF